MKNNKENWKICQNFSYMISDPFIIFQEMNVSRGDEDDTEESLLVAAVIVAVNEDDDVNDEEGTFPFSLFFVTSLICRISSSSSKLLSKYCCWTNRDCRRDDDDDVDDTKSRRDIETLLIETGRCRCWEIFLFSWSKKGTGVTFSYFPSINPSLSRRMSPISTFYLSSLYLEIKQPLS